MLIKDIKQKRIQAMKDKDTVAKNLYATIIAECEQKSKDLKQEAPTDEQVLKVIKKFKVNAEENHKISGNEQFVQEAELLGGFLPQQMSEEELRLKISDIVKDLEDKSPRAIGVVMGQLKKYFSGQFEGKMASQIIKELLQ